MQTRLESSEVNIIVPAILGLKRRCAQPCTLGLPHVPRLAASHALSSSHLTAAYSPPSLLVLTEPESVDERRELLAKLQDRLEGLLVPKLKAALRARNEGMLHGAQGVMPR